MNLKDLQYFSSLAKHENFSRAAKECFVTQPTLSNQISKLEEELQLVLFERSNRKVNITEEGKLILEAAQKALENVSDIKKLAHRFKEPLIGKLTLGAIHTLSPYLLPIILLPLKEAYPDLDLIMVEATTLELLEELNAGKIDAALVGTSVKKEKKLKEIKLFKEPFWIAHPVSHKIYNIDDINVNDLQKLEETFKKHGVSYSLIGKFTGYSICFTGDSKPIIDLSVDKAQKTWFNSLREMVLRA